MIVDAHVALDSRRFPAPRALETLRAANVGRAVVFADARAEDPAHENRYILRVAQEQDLIPFYYLGGNPWTDTRPDVLDLPDDFPDYAGVRWHRWVGEGLDREGRLDRGELDWAIALMESSEFQAFASAAALYNMPVMFEEGLAVTLEFVERFPSLDIIIPHLGARSGGEAKVLRSLWDVPNVYFDTSLGELDETTLSRVGYDRIFFGSAYPYGDPEAELQKIDALPVPESVKERIYGDNLMSLLSQFENV